ncbi:MAG: hypothetical protein COT90_02930 [Candidatus Diapherotrites archaeon CG10_big_fil_rev_8_21_14_0_10_31_34]|nr:MAG: hypothetical protein COT90_02930 [Candidatus Diapherotrites archaeon CG10_big_fil_rev_8_21_14_0_10_31_34]
MEKNTLISLVIGLIVFAIVLFIIADSAFCTDISKEACFNSVLFHPVSIIMALIIGLIVFVIAYFVTKRFNSSK